MTIVEKVARALQLNDYKFSHLPWNCLSHHTQHMFLSDAQAAIETTDVVKLRSIVVQLVEALEMENPLAWLQLINEAKATLESQSNEN